MKNCSILSLRLRKIKLLLLGILIFLNIVCSMKETARAETKFDLLKTGTRFFENWLFCLGSLLIFISIFGVIMTFASFGRRK